MYNFMEPVSPHKNTKERSMRRDQYLGLATAVIALLMSISSVQAQSKSVKSSNQLAPSRAEVASSTQKYKESLEAVLTLDEGQVKQTAELLAKRRQLFDQGIISKRELEQSEAALTTAQAKLNQMRQQIAEADNLIAEAEMAEELVRPQPAQIHTQPALSGAYRDTGTMIRYNGAAGWSLKELSEVQAFYAANFGRALPTSAIGQSATHNKLGFDHRNSVDVAVHPDSAQGKALINYLRSEGIPFIAFRSAVPGSATGAHIHIGLPSHRTTATA